MAAILSSSVNVPKFKLPVTANQTGSYEFSDFVPAIGAILFKKRN